MVTLAPTAWADILQAGFDTNWLTPGTNNFYRVIFSNQLGGDAC